MAEMIPYEPDAGNAAEGKSSPILLRSSFPAFYQKTVWNGNYHQQPTTGT